MSRLILPRPVYVATDARQRNVRRGSSDGGDFARIDLAPELGRLRRRTGLLAAHESAFLLPPRAGDRRCGCGILACTALRASSATFRRLALPTASRSGFSLQRRQP